MILPDITNCNNKKAPVSKSFFFYLAICRDKVLPDLIYLYQFKQRMSMVEMPGVAPGGNDLVVPYLHLPSPPNLVVSIKAKSVNEENSSRNRLEHFALNEENPYGKW